MSGLTKAEALQKLHACDDALRERGVRELSIFGSVARDEAGEDSDIDLLVSFIEPPSFRGFMDLKFMLEEVLGRRVDLVTRAGLRPRVQPHVEREAVRVAC